MFGYHTLLRLNIGLSQHAGCGLCQDLMLGQLRSLLGKISIQIRPRAPVVAFEIEDRLLIVYSRRF